jgi:hypothetical protein
MPVFWPEEVINFFHRIELERIRHDALSLHIKSTIRRPFGHNYFIDNLADKDRILGLGQFSKR